MTLDFCKFKRTVEYNNNDNNNDDKNNNYQNYDINNCIVIDTGYKLDYYLYTKNGNIYIYNVKAAKGGQLFYTTIDMIKEGIKEKRYKVVSELEAVEHIIQFIN